MDVPNDAADPRQRAGATALLLETQRRESTEATVAERDAAIAAHVAAHAALEAQRAATQSRLEEAERQGADLPVFSDRGILPHPSFFV